MTRRRWRLLATLDQRGPLGAAEVTLMVSPEFEADSVLTRRTAAMWAHAYVAPLIEAGYVALTGDGRFGITERGRQAWNAESSMPLFETIRRP